ncbi:unnamed protein product [Brassica rapa]|uniref:Uncharacterized protein n=1 Tax=Brassica campestris TaxID=3711 RepID=A0A3P6CDM1_BRACM|nr:unnamed protein product [Brassica rapa]VDD12128.1 unnamed protein product [Brassica rapa]
MKRRHLIKRSSEVVITRSILFQFSQTNSKASMALEIIGRHALFFDGYLCKLPDSAC